MFGESESESPRVPSPWDSIISTSPEPTALSIDNLPRLIPENDDGNVEYKLQLLDPSPARFSRLVTQLKWRLLEGGGQAYYELGVADSGALVGLPRAELEQSLETLEMMAGEIGASVIVVKEIEVPAAMAGLAASQTTKWNGERKRRLPRPGSEISSTEEEYERTEAEASRLRASSPAPLFPMDPEPEQEPGIDAHVSIDLEIASVFKPRPMRARMQIHTSTSTHHLGTKTKRLKKIKHITNPDDDDDVKPSIIHNSRDHTAKAQSRRQTRDRKREEKRRALIAYATSSQSSSTVSVTQASSSSLSFCPSPSPGPVPFTGDELEHTHDPTPAETSALVSGLAALHVSVDESLDVGGGDDDGFLSGLIEDVDVPKDTSEVHKGHGSRLIVEALVVRKMSLDEAFLDFEGFMLT